MRLRLKRYSPVWVNPNLLRFAFLLAAPAFAGVALREGFCGLSADDFERLDRGEAIGRVLPSHGEKEIGIFAAVKLTVPKEAVRAWYSDARNFKESKVVIEAGEFHRPPRAEDVAAYGLTPGDIEDARRCRPGDCGLKLAADAMERLRRNAGREDEAARDMLLALATAYLERGEAALVPYDDRKESVDPSAEFRKLLEAPDCVREAFPAIENSVPVQRNLFWSVERYGFGLKPLLNVTDARMYRPGPGVLIVWARQIYGSHYYDASLAVTVVWDAPEGGSYMIYINRSRVDLLAGVWRGWKRRLVEMYAPGSIRREIRAIARSVERLR